MATFTKLFCLLPKYYSATLRTLQKLVSYVCDKHPESSELIMN